MVGTLLFVSSHPTLSDFLCLATAVLRLCGRYAYYELSKSQNQPCMVMPSPVEAHISPGLRS